MILHTSFLPIRAVAYKQLLPIDTIQLLLNFFSYIYNLLHEFVNVSIKINFLFDIAYFASRFTQSEPRVVQLGTYVVLSTYLFWVGFNLHYNFGNKWNQFGLLWHFNRIRVWRTSPGRRGRRPGPGAGGEHCQLAILLLS